MALLSGIKMRLFTTGTGDAFELARDRFTTHGCVFLPGFHPVGKLKMNHPAQGAHSAASPSDMRGTITLRVVDRRTVPYLCRSGAGTAENNNHCLLHLVALTGPKIHSTQTRRLRLKDSLAGGNANRNASILSKDPHFWDYLQQINLTAYDAEIDARRARHFINRVCEVSSRHQLGHENGATQRFFNLIERPFLEWLRAVG